MLGMHKGLKRPFSDHFLLSVEKKTPFHSHHRLDHKYEKIIVQSV